MAERQASTMTLKPPSTMWFESNGIFFSFIIPAIRGSGGQLLFNSLRYVKKVPFPRLALVWRKSLAPNRTIFVPCIPTKHHNNRFSLEGVFAKEMSDTIFKRADHGRIEDAGITRHPIQTPQPGPGIKKAQGETLKELAFLAWELGGRIGVHIRGVAENFRVLIGGVEFRPLFAVFQSFVEVAIMHLPFSDQEIEVVRR